MDLGKRIMTMDLQNSDNWDQLPGSLMLNCWDQLPEITMLKHKDQLPESLMLNIRNHLPNSWMLNMGTFTTQFYVKY